jgi:hypothetical protein
MFALSCCSGCTIAKTMGPFNFSIFNFNDWAAPQVGAWVVTAWPPDSHAPLWELL